MLVILLQKYAAAPAKHWEIKNVVFFSLLKNPLI